MAFVLEKDREKAGCCCLLPVRREEVCCSVFFSVLLPEVKEATGATAPYCWLGLFVIAVSLIWGSPDLEKLWIRRKR